MQPSHRFASTFARGIGLLPAAVDAAGLMRDGWSIEPAGVSVAVLGRPRLAGSASWATVGASDVRDAYRRHGRHFAREFEGPFALVILDAADDTLLLAVDRIGIQPLCYAPDGDRIHFGERAGDVASLLTPDVPAGGSGPLDAQSIFNYLYFHCIPGPDTVFRGVRRVLAGHVVVFAGGQTSELAYWAPTYDERKRSPLAELERGFLDTVKASVGRAIEGAARPGCFLSGGTDSSTVAGMLGAVTGEPARTYSIGFDAQGFDEIGYARAASRHFKTDQHEYYITPSDLVASIPLIAASFDQPFGNSSVLPTYYCARMAAADGIDRLLGGDGGDELFGGNTRYAKQRVFDYYDRAPAALQRLLKTGLAPKAWAAVPLAKKAQSYVQQASIPMPDRMQSYNLVSRIGVDTIFEAAFLEGVDRDAPMAAMRAWYARAQTDNLVNRMLAFDFKYTLTDNDLPKVVTGCRAAGVDVAFPFLDDRVVAFAETLDPELKLKGFQLRWFFKHALRDFLPKEILTKSKHGFGLPFGIWMRRDKALNALAFESLDALKSRGIVRPAFIDLLRADLLGDHATYYGEMVWVLMMLEQWLVAHERMPLR